MTIIRSHEELKRIMNGLDHCLHGKTPRKTPREQGENDPEATIATGDVSKHPQTKRSLFLVKWGSQHNLSILRRTQRSWSLVKDEGVYVIAESSIEAINTLTERIEAEFPGSSPHITSVELIASEEDTDTHTLVVQMRSIK